MNRIVCFVATILIGTVNCQLRKINLSSCGGGSIVDAYAGPCVDTPGCALPQCCGALANSPANFTAIYTANVNAQGGRLTLSILGLTLSTNTDDPLSNLFLPLPVPIPAPYPIVAYSNDMCTLGMNAPLNPGFCPQTAGEQYIFTHMVSVPIQLATTAGLVAKFQIKLTSGSDTVLCVTAYGRFFMTQELTALIPGLG